MLADKTLRYCFWPQSAEHKIIFNCGCLSANTASSGVTSWRGSGSAPGSRRIYTTYWLVPSTNHPTHGSAFSFMLAVLNTFLQIRVFIRIWRTLDSNAQHNICLSRRHAVSLDATFKMFLPSIFLPLWSCLQMLQKPSSFRNIYFILTLSKTYWMLDRMLDVIW